MTQTATGGTAGDQAREKAQAVGAQTKERAQEVGAQARERAQEAGAQARGRVRDEVDRRSSEAGEQAGSAAQALRDASGRLREEGKEPVARGLEQVADRVERAGGWLRDSDGDSILREVEDFGRRNTLAVVAGGVAVGLVASRLLKASSRRRYESGSAQLPGTADGGSGNGLTSGRVAPDTTVGAGGGAGVVGPGATEPGAAPSAPVAPREGVTEAGLSGGTPATSPTSWQGGLGEGEGHRAP
jgi:hypothetical protein